MADAHGTFALVLHSHLPYVLSHDRLEEEWLLEAVVESYLPLISLLERLVLLGISPKITIGLTPVLLEQLAAPQFPRLFLSYLEEKGRAAREDQRIFRNRKADHLARLAELWAELYRRSATFFSKELSSNLIGAFASLQRRGHIELLASAATHAYLPLLGFDEHVRAQIEIGTRCYQRYFAARPRGFWLPECAYRPAGSWTTPVKGVDGEFPSDRQAIDHMLSAAGIQYFMVDGRQLTASPPHYQRNSPFCSYLVDGRAAISYPPVSLFPRDFQTTIRVWQHDGGYPGDPAYLEFHRKQVGGELRYWRITDRQIDLAHKQPYIPDWAFAQVAVHATQFVQAIREALRNHWLRTREPGLLVAAFDTELFGHWWFEGPQWIFEVLRQLAATGDVEVMTCGSYLSQHPSQRTVQLQESSWGDGGDHRVWLQEKTHQLWRDVYQAEVDMRRLGERIAGKSVDPQLLRLLRQSAREFLLLQSSDWPFMVGTGSTVDHAHRRAAQHSTNFQRLRYLADQYLKQETVSTEDWQFLEACEQQNRLFADLDPQLFWHATSAAPGASSPVVQGAAEGLERESSHVVI
jgi:1,4-alpha-glucan branching enzyme